LGHLLIREIDAPVVAAFRQGREFGIGAGGGQVVAGDAVAVFI
jgi:hypothetical protein